MTLASDPVLLDCDGVASDMVNHALAEVGYNGPSPTSWEFRPILSKPQQDHIERLLNDPVFWRTIPTVPGSQAGVEFIRSLGFNVHWVTSPWYSCEGWDYARRSWLLENFGATPDQITITSRKDLVRGLAIIDDKPTNVLDWRTRNPGGFTLLYAQPYNGSTPRTWYSERADWSSIPEIFKILSMLLKQQKGGEVYAQGH